MSNPKLYVTKKHKSVYKYINTIRNMPNKINWSSCIHRKYDFYDFSSYFIHSNIFWKTYLKNNMKDNIFVSKNIGVGATVQEFLFLNEYDSLLLINLFSELENIKAKPVSLEFNICEVLDYASTHSFSNFYDGHVNYITREFSYFLRSHFKKQIFIKNTKYTDKTIQVDLYSDEIEILAEMKLRYGI